MIIYICYVTNASLVCIIVYDDIYNMYNNLTFSIN